MNDDWYVWRQRLASRIARTDFTLFDPDDPELIQIAEDNWNGDLFERLQGTGMPWYVSRLDATVEFGVFESAMIATFTWWESVADHTMGMVRAVNEAAQAERGDLERLSAEPEWSNWIGPGEIDLVVEEARLLAEKSFPLLSNGIATVLVVSLVERLGASLREVVIDRLNLADSRKKRYSQRGDPIGRLRSLLTEQCDLGDPIEPRLADDWKDLRDRRHLFVHELGGGGSWLLMPGKQIDQDLSKADVIDAFRTAGRIAAAIEDVLIGDYL